MAIAFIGSVAAGSVGGTSVTSGAVTTSGNLLVLSLSTYAGVARPTTPTDNKGNTSWVALTDQAGASSGRQTIFYHLNPVVGASHTFTVSGVASCSPGIIVSWYSGAHATPFDVENGATQSSGTSLVSGSVTPSEAGELVVVGLTADPVPSLLIDLGFTITNQIAYSGGDCFASAFAYKIHTSGAINPTWSWTGASVADSRTATFKEAAAGGTSLALGLGALSLTGRQAVVSAVGPNTAHIIIRPS